MKLDDEVCLCFHVTRRKIENYLRIEKPRRAAQLSECQGAGTGCGWCCPYLEHLFQRYRAQQSNADAPSSSDELPSAEEYAAARKRYHRAGNSRTSDEL